MSRMTKLTQTAPWPAELEDLVKRSHYRAHEGWRTQLIPDLLRDPADTHGAEGRGTTLVVTTNGFDTYHPEAGREYRVRHFFIVPAATYNAASWTRWLYERYLDVERHECMENFILTSEKLPSLGPWRPFAPTHGPGDDPYVVHEYAAVGAEHRRYDEPAAPKEPTPTRSAAELLREVAQRDPEGHKRSLARGYGLGRELDRAAPKESTP